MSGTPVLTLMTVLPLIGAVYCVVYLVERANPTALPPVVPASAPVRVRVAL